MGRVSTSSPARDAERRRGGATVLDAVLERITYANDETGYTIARVATDRCGADLLTVVGALLGVQPGESLRLVGRWSSHPRYGRQFEVESYSTVLPATIQGIERLPGLRSGQGDRAADRGADCRALRGGHPAGDRGAATAAGRGAGPGPKRSRRFSSAKSRCQGLSVGSCSHQSMPISRALSTDATSIRILIVKSSISSRFT